MDFKIQQDSAATVSPLQIVNSTRPVLENIEVVTSYKDCITIGSTTDNKVPTSLRMINVNTFPQADSYGVLFDIPSGNTCSAFLFGCRFNGPGTTTKAGVRANIGGSIDGLYIRDCGTSDHNKGIEIVLDESGANIDNVLIQGNLIDQVDQIGIGVSAIFGATVGNVMISDNVVNGTVGATSATEGVIEFTGAGTWDGYVNVLANEIRNASRYGLRIGSSILSGNYIISGNTFHDYDRDDNAAGAAIEFDGTLDYLEITDNRLDSANTRDFDIRDDGATVTKRKISGNEIIGGAATIAPENLTLKTLTIAAGVVTMTDYIGSSYYHRIDTEAAGATDDLDTINGGKIGDVIKLQAANDSRTVVVKDGTGNIQLPGDFSLDNTVDTIVLVHDGSSWKQLSSSTLLHTRKH
jgi:hypothetical protein